MSRKLDMLREVGVGIYEQTLQCGDAVMLPPMGTYELNWSCHWCNIPFVTIVNSNFILDLARAFAIRDAD